MLMHIGCSSYQSSEPLPVIDNQIREIWKVEKPTSKGFEAGSGSGWSTIRTLPIIDGDRIYLPFDSVVQCLSVSRGSVEWSVRIVDETDSSPWTHFDADHMILENGRLYVAATQGFLVCLDASDGSRLWKKKYSTGFGFYFNEYSQSPEALYVSARDNNEVLKISKSTGQVLWHCAGALLTSEPEYSIGWLGAPTYYEGRVFVTARYGASKWQPQVWHDGSAAGIDDITGKLLWTKIIPPPDSTVGYAHPELLQETDAGRGLVPYEGGILFASGFNIVRMDLDGNIMWRRTTHLNGNVNVFQITPLVHEGKLYVLDNYLLSSLDPLTGEVFWTKLFTRRENDKYTFHNPLQIVGNTIYSWTDDYRIFGADMSTGNTVYAVDLSPHLYKYETGEFLLRGGVKIMEEKLFAVDRQYGLAL